jgi:deoxyribonuclease V
MKIVPLHSWDLDTSAAVALQKELASRIDVCTPVDRCELIAGADISYNRFSGRYYAGVVVLRTHDWSIVEKQQVIGESPFPYEPGLLTFREGPIVLEALARLESAPELFMFDGQGRAHPRRFGLACHLGLWLDRPSLGCAKSRLIGRFERLANEAGSTAPLTADDGEILGKVVRTREGVQPVYVSAGHKIDLESAVRWTLASCQGYRIPEPTRQAHLHVNELRRQDGG